MVNPGSQYGRHTPLRETAAGRGLGPTVMGFAWAVFYQRAVRASENYLVSFLPFSQLILLMSEIRIIAAGRESRTRDLMAGVGCVTIVCQSAP